MARRSYYSSVSRSKRPKSHTVAIVLGVILVLLVAFIIWSVIVFAGGGDGVFQSQAKEISELKIALSEKDAQIASLTEQIEQFEGKGIQQSGEMFGPPAASPTPVPSPTPQPTAAPPRTTARPTVAPTEVPTAPPAAPQNTPVVRQPQTTEPPIGPGSGV